MEAQEAASVAAEPWVKQCLGRAAQVPGEAPFCLGGRVLVCVFQGRNPLQLRGSVIR